MGRASMGRNSLGRKIKNTPLIKKIDLSSAQGISARRRSPPIGGERLRGDFPRAEIPVPLLEGGGSKNIGIENFGEKFANSALS